MPLVARVARRLCVASLLLTVLAFPPIAAADGGTSISSGPSAVAGQQQFGNLANGSVQHTDLRNDVYRSWWNLETTSGDQVRVEWQVSARSGYGYPALTFLPIGTTDFNFESASPVVTQQTSSTLKNELTFNAPRTGTMPFEFFAAYVDNPSDPVLGPYDFTIYVRHLLKLGFAVPETTKTRSTLTVRAFNADGARIAGGARVALQYSNGRRWKNAGSAPIEDGVGAVKIRLPRSVRGKTVSLRARGTGPGYVPATTRVARVRIV